LKKFVDEISTKTFRHLRAATNLRGQRNKIAELGIKVCDYNPILKGGHQENSTEEPSWTEEITWTIDKGRQDYGRSKLQILQQ
jgi:hypothetical protein